jgi:dCTP deaminase
VILNDREIKALLRRGELSLVPHDPELIQASSIDLRLDQFARRVKDNEVELCLREDLNEDAYEGIEIDGSGYLIPSASTFIGQTMEHIKIPETCQGSIAQRSSVVRIGVHVSSSLLNPGYQGNLPLLIRNDTGRTIRVHAGMPICQLVLTRLIARPDVVYSENPSAKYHGERKFLESRIAEDVRRWARPPSPRLVDPSQADFFRKQVEEEAEDEGL